MKATKSDLTAARLRERFNYDPETGIFTLRSGKSRYPIGRQVGCPDRTGYIQVYLDGRTYMAHRLAWLHVYGEWPPETIDHINRVRDDNRIENPRLASYLENNQNVGFRRNNKSGIKGVYWSAGSGRWKAQIMVEYRNRSLGSYLHIDDAIAARKAAEAKYHPFAAKGLHA